MSDVPQGTVQEVLDWVGDDPGRAQEALDAERDGQNRSTLIAQLESVRPHEEEPVSETDETTEETGLAPGPEQPEETVIYAEDAGTVVHPVSVRDGDVEVAEDATIAADPRYDRSPEAVAARGRVDFDADDVDVNAIEGSQVEFVGGASSTNGLALNINGDVFMFNSQMVGALKQIVDRAVVGMAL